MSALGQKQTHAVQQRMSALAPIATTKADFRKRYVCFPPKSGHVQCTKICRLRPKSGHLDEHRHFRRRARARRSNICDQAEGLALFRDRAIVANFILMGDAVRSGLGACGEAAIMKRKVYANVA